MWDDGTIWEGTREGTLLLRACGPCGEICHPPLPMCPHCQSTIWDTRAACGRASLRSWLVSIRPDCQNEPPRIVIVAQLQEGVSFVSNLSGIKVEELYEGMPLELYFETVGNLTLPLFRPAGYEK
jgi:hypothetical protein